MANPIKLIKAVKKATQSSIAQKKNYKEKVTIRGKRVLKAAKQEDKANKRGLKAANKPLSKGNKKLLKDIGQMTNYIAMDRRPTPPTVQAALGGRVPDGMRGAFAAAKKIAMQEARSEGPAKKISPAQKALNKRMGK